MGKPFLRKTVAGRGESMGSFLHFVDGTPEMNVTHMYVNNTCRLSTWDVEKS